jgi:DNA adenine methylase
MSTLLPRIQGLDEPARVRPFVRWAGGKTRLLKHLRPHLPHSFERYYEPFLGGGAVFFEAGDRAKDKAILADLNEELINLWLAVRDQPLELLEALRDYTGKDSEGDYYAVRDGDVPIDDLGRAARFFYLNQTAWNGLWRVNRWGRFNVPWGARPFRGTTEEELLRARAALSKADVRVADFRDVLKEPSKGDFVYLDPPYLPLSDTSKFYLYTEQRFRRPDLEELARICRDLTKRGVTWLLSNRDTPLVRELFAEADIVPLTTRRSVAAQNRRDVEAADSPEVIVVGLAA